MFKRTKNRQYTPGQKVVASSRLTLEALTEARTAEFPDKFSRNSTSSSTGANSLTGTSTTTETQMFATDFTLTLLSVLL